MPMIRYYPGFGAIEEGDPPTKTDYILDDPEVVYNTGEGNTLYHHTHRDIWFYSSPYSVLGGEYNLNRKFMCEGVATEGDLYRLWKLPKKFHNMDECGWEQYKGEIDYGHMWIDFVHFPAMTKSGKPVMVIEEATLPYPDYLEPTNDIETISAYRRWEEQR